MKFPDPLLTNKISEHFLELVGDRPTDRQSDLLT